MTSVRVPWSGGVVHALRVAARTALPRFTAVFVHGADRTHQNAEHWRPHLPALAAAFPDAELYAVDLPGHGHSEPGALAAEPPSDAATVQSLATFLAHVHRHQPLVLVGRSKGGRQVFQAACQAAPAVQAALAALVLVAPAVNKPFMDLLPPRVRSTRTLLFWALDDPDVPYATHTAVLDSMPVCACFSVSLLFACVCWTFLMCVFFFRWWGMWRRTLCSIRSGMCSARARPHAGRHTAPRTSVQPSSTRRPPISSAASSRTEQARPRVRTLLGACVCFFLLPVATFCECGQWLDIN